MVISLGKNELFARVRTVIGKSYDLPNTGTGAPGMLLENLLGVKTNQSDLPDAGGWEIKFSAGKSLLTMFHKTPKPDGVLKNFLLLHGWEGKDGRINFRHTISGKSPKGFRIEDNGEELFVRHEKGPECHWTHDDIINAASSKIRRLLLVTGTKRNNVVTFDAARALDEFRITKFIPAAVSGLVKIEFDARFENGARDIHAVRDHGTKFRISPTNLPSLYKRNSSI